MAIIQQTDGTYLVRYQKRHTLTREMIGFTRTNIIKGDKKLKITTKADAQRVERELIAAAHEKIKAAVIPKWSQVLLEYYSTFSTSDLTNKTMYNRKITLDAHTQLLSDRYINEITTQDIYEVLNTRFKNLSEATRKSFIKCIRYVFTFALEKGYVLRNPTPLIKFKANEKIKSVLNEQQIEILLQRAHETDCEWHPHWAMALFTGMRNGELFALEWQNVDLEKRMIYVKSSWTKQDGYKDTKSGDDRVIEIPNPLLPVLYDLKAQSDGSTFVLPRVHGWDQGDQARYLRLFLQAQSEQLPAVRFHDLRASWATLLLSKGVAPSKVMAQGGWRNMQTMMIYMRKAGIDIKDSTNVLDHIKLQSQKNAEIVDLNDHRM